MNQLPENSLRILYECYFSFTSYLMNNGLELRVRYKVDTACRVLPYI